MLFQQIKALFTKDVNLTLPGRNHPFFITVDLSVIDTGFVLFQIYNKRKLDIISYYSCKFTSNGQKLCTVYRDLIGVVYS